ncbi:uncharacterized protein LTR77_002218 [Saxophila tyrrhenica]|uniref:SnoaL-like domain-containing protein n=1 Tax=Saxophila tyrrhenica TaxID=1690608 RepID=A0AAV9PIB2_9PEZI|nr:hypothetical protein LTR77_002218 [Saxophila tyrrhenica]
MSSNLDNQKSLTAKFIKIEEAWDIEANIQLRTNDCIYHLRPTTLGHPPRNNDEFREFYTSLKALWTDYKLEVLQTTHDAETHKSVIHAINYAETPAGPFEMECIMILSFTEDGTKLKRVEELADSAYLNEFLERVAKVTMLPTEQSS